MSEVGPQACARLVEDLRREVLAMQRWSEQRRDIERIVKESIGTGTYRAFHRQAPASVVEPWARERLGDPQVREAILSLVTREEYDRWVRDFSEDLRERWRAERGAEMHYARCRKIMDLFMKYFVLWEGLTDGQRERLIGLVHVPFDSRSLAKIRDCWNSSQAREVLGTPIRASATMSFADNEPLYDALQALCRDIADEAGVPPIYIDVLAWEVSEGVV